MGTDIRQETVMMRVHGFTFGFLTANLSERIPPAKLAANPAKHLISALYWENSDKSLGKAAA